MAKFVPMTANKALVLNHKQIEQKINRIAHELHENNFEEKELIILGIENRGALVAERLAKLLKDITDIKISLGSIKIDKDAPLDKEIACSISAEDAQGKTVILVDDVLNTGKALIFAARFVLGMDVKRLQTVTLVDRRHRSYPIRADYVGLTLATTLQEHISVEFGEQDAVYLT